LNLVTGATGIVGSHVVLALLQNNQAVVACKQKSSDISKLEKLFSYYTPNYKQLFYKINWVEMDLTEMSSIEDALEGITAVYHCAGFVSLNKKDREKLFAINEKGTENMVNACLQKKIRALCHVSSIATINNLDYTLPLSEEVFWKKSGKESDYAISKYNAEREVWRGIEEGLNALIVNPGVILSPGFWNQSSSKIFDTCYKGNKFYTSGTSGYIGALDLANTMINLVHDKKFANRYIIIENNYTIQSIFNSIQKQFHKAGPTIKVNKVMLQIGRMAQTFYSLFTGKEVVLTKALINSAFTSQLYSNKKILANTNLHFTAIEEIIAQICKIYLAEKKTQSK
jgi:nucleoside-diphosphate-sugar epimerase